MSAAKAVAQPALAAPATSQAWAAISRTCPSSEVGNRKDRPMAYEADVRRPRLPGARQHGLRGAGRGPDVRLAADGHAEDDDLRR